MSHTIWVKPQLGKILLALSMITGQSYNGIHRGNRVEASIPFANYAQERSKSQLSISDLILAVMMHFIVIS